MKFVLEVRHSVWHTVEKEKITPSNFFIGMESITELCFLKMWCVCMTLAILFFS